MPGGGLIVECRDGSRARYIVVFTDAQIIPQSLSLYDDRNICIWRTTAPTREQLIAALREQLARLELRVILASRVEPDDWEREWFTGLRQQD